MFASESRSRLKVGQALRDGWRAFQRAPLMFVGFSLMVFVTQTILQVMQEGLQGLQTQLSGTNLPPLTPDGAGLGSALSWLRSTVVVNGLIVLNILTYVVVSLWGACGMVRAAWVALGGGRPRLITFLLVDPRAMLRLFLATVLLGCGVGVMVLLMALLGSVLSWISPFLVVVPILIFLAGLIYIVTTQAFLNQVALLHDRNPFKALALGRQVVDPIWLDVFMLGLLYSGLVIAGFLACFVGFFVAMPVSVCMVTAAYRQLFGPEDRTGLLRTLPAAGS